MKLLNLLLFVGLMVYAIDVTAQSVYVTKTGEKYHKRSCHYLKNSKKEITLEKAKEFRFTACAVCKPTASANTNSFQTFTGNTNKTPSSSATQCTGKTQTDVRCKRMTKSENGRCYQHE